MQTNLVKNMNIDTNYKIEGNERFKSLHLVDVTLMHTSYYIFVLIAR